MSRHPRLRTLLLAVVASAVLPMALLALTRAWLDLRDAEARELQTLAGYARLAADQHARSIDGTRQLLTTLAQGPALRDPALQALCADYLARIAAQLPGYSAFVLANPDGRLRCASTWNTGQFVGDRAYFAPALAGQPFVYGGMVVGRQTGRTVLSFAVPVHGADGAVNGVLVTGVDIGKLRSEKTNAVVPGWLKLRLVDADATLIATLTGPDNAPAGEPLPAQALRDAIARGEPATLADGVDGARGWHATQPLAAGQARLWVVASAPPQQLREPVMRRMAWQAGGLALVLVAAGAMAWTVGTRWVSEPAERLRQRIRQRMSGDAVPDDAPAPRRSREIDDIDAAFRALDGTLAQRERRLQAQLHRLHLLHRITHAAGARLDAASIEAVVVDHVEQHLPADACAFATVDKDAGTLVLGTCGPLAAAALPAAGLARGTALAVGHNGLSHCLQGELVCDNDLGRRDAPLARQLVAAGFGSLALAPLPGADEGVAGVLLATRRGTPLQSADCEFLAQLARHVALATHHAALYARLQHSYDELRGTQQRMLEQERLRAIGQMASGIAHDINNALAPALLHADALLEHDGTLGESVHARLDAIRHGIEAVATTVARLRELYRPGAGDTFAPLDANALLRQVAELTRARWHDQAQRDGVDIELRLELADALPPLPAVRTELRDALVNLVFNAVDAMPGGGTLTLASARAELPDGRAAVGLSVLDSGAGMDEATRARCLEPFFSTKGERGSGLGLPMVALAAERHGGRLDIASTPGHGSRFTLRLPLQQPAPAPAPFPTALPESARPAPLRLLVVDDDAAVREAIATQLRVDGHEVVEAASGRQALALLRAALGRGRPPHAVLSDMGMPDLDGRALALAVKALAPSLPVLMITGWGRGLADDALPAGVDMLLAKPLRLQELRAALLRASPPPPAPPPPE